jgi:FAD:protein FMN transferase
MRKIILFLLPILLIFSACFPLQEVKKSENMMGTVFDITVYDSDKANAEIAIDAAYAEIARIDNLLSIYKNDSEISMLNRDKQIKNPSADFIDNVKKSVYYSNLSDGAFDITVQPILDLYTESFLVNKRAPTATEILKIVKRIDYKKIIITNNSISIGADQEITLGGIAKGYSVEKAIEVLKSYGIEHALVNAGGNMRALGEKPGNIDWNIALRNPRDENEYITIITLNDNAVSTSGDYERYFNENKTFHHIINPKTGYSATELISVTIVMDNAYDSDALSTTVFVLGPEKGMALAEKLGVKALIITRDRQIIKSKNWDY